MEDNISPALDAIIEEQTGPSEPGKGQDQPAADSSGSKDNSKLDISLFDEDGRKKSQATLLIEIGRTAELFHCENQDAYAQINRNGANIIFPVRSKSFKEHLSHELYNLIGKGANATAITDAIATIEAVAKYNGKLKTVAIRTHRENGSIYIDSGCNSWRAIRIDKTGWTYIYNPPVKFIRKRGMTAFPDPGTISNLGLLKKYINISDDEFPLIYGWLLCALAGVKPYPILVLQGEQGTGKSTTSRVLRLLSDPSTVPLRSPPKDTRDLLVSAANNHVVMLDNLSGLNPEISDCLCRLSTGGGIDVRALFTDGEQFLVDIQKPVLVNGIDDIATRPDLAERALIINLPVIDGEKRRSESEFWAEFETDKSKIFAGLLSCIVRGLQRVDQTILVDKPRMADAAQWITACENADDAGISFIDAHKKNQLEAVELGIEASPLGSAILEMMKINDRLMHTPGELLTILSDIAGNNQIRSKSWPQSPKGLGNIIERLKPNFRKMGIKIERRRNTNGRYYILERIPE